MKIRTLIFLYLLFRILELIIVLLAPNFLPFQSGFTFDDETTPMVFRAYAHYDGVIYTNIAERGYREQNEYAFFPLYPLFINSLRFFFGRNTLYTGLFISLLSFLGSIYFLVRFLEDLKVPAKTIFWTILFLLSFPTSFFFHAVYTESLFLFLSTAALYSLYKKKYFLTFIFGFFAPLTRFVGLFLIVPFAIHFLYQFQETSSGKKFKNIGHFVASFFRYASHNLNRFMILLAPILGICVYSWYLYIHTGDPLTFFHAQASFGEQRASSFVLLPQILYRYIKIFITADFSLVYFVSVVEFAIFISVCGVLLYLIYHMIKKRQWTYMTTILGSFTLINICLSTFTGSLMSIPRFALISLMFFIGIAQSRNTFAKTIILVIFLILHVVLLSLFSRGYFVS